MNPTARILVIEDDTLVISALKLLLKSHDLEFHRSLPQYFASIAATTRREFDLVLLDLCHAADPTGTQTRQLIPELQQKLPHAELVIQSGLKDIAIMRQCLQLGAEKFVLKDHIADEIPVFVSHSLERRKLRQELDASIIGNSKVIGTLKRRLLDLRKQHNSVDVLIEGETGTGKELCAKALHREGPFIAINVAAIPADLFEAELFGAEKGAYTGSTQARAGYLESVENGVLFLDEIQSLALSLQAKLLRVIESRTFMRVGSTVERRFHGRIISASNQSLATSVEKGHFREDLYFRLTGALVSVPPLRARTEDIENLARFFLRDLAQQHLQFTYDAFEALRNQYDWPGNVRELRSVVRTLALESKMPFIDAPEVVNLVRRNDLALAPVPTEMAAESAADVFLPRPHLGFDANVCLFERYLIRSALRGRNNIQARESLGLSRSRFYEKLKQYALHGRENHEA